MCSVPAATIFERDGFELGGRWSVARVWMDCGRQLVELPVQDHRGHEAAVGSAQVEYPFDFALAEFGVFRGIEARILRDRSQNFERLLETAARDRDRDSRGIAIADDVELGAEALRALGQLSGRPASRSSRLEQRASKFGETGF